MAVTFKRLERRRESIDEAAAKRAAREARRDKQAATDRGKERGARISMERELGRLARVIGLSDLPAEEIRGAFYSLEDGVGDERTRAQWRRKDGEWQERDAAARDKKREPLVVKFSGPVPGILTNELRKAGLRFNRLFTRWEGQAVLEDVLALARAHDGVVSRVEPDSTLTVVEKLASVNIEQAAK